MGDDYGQIINLWLLFWPVLAIGSYIGYVITSKKQGAKVGVGYTLLLALALMVWLGVLFAFR